MSCFWEYCVSASNSFLKLTPQVTFVTSPLAVDFRGFMARQSPHIIYRQAGRLVGLQCQRWEPVHGHKWEEAGIIDWVLVPENRDEDVKMAELSKSAGIHRGVMLGGSPHRPLRKKLRLCLPGSTKGESYPQCLNSNLHALHRNVRDQRKKIKSSGAVYQSAYVQKQCCLSLGDKFPPFILASCSCINI